MAPRGVSAEQSPSELARPGRIAGAELAQGRGARQPRAVNSGRSRSAPHARRRPGGARRGRGAGRAGRRRRRHGCQRRPAREREARALQLRGGQAGDPGQLRVAHPDGPRARRRGSRRRARATWSSSPRSRARSDRRARPSTAPPSSASGDSPSASARTCSLTVSASRSSRPASCAARGCGPTPTSNPPPMIGTTTPEKVAEAVVRAIERTATRSRWRRCASVSWPRSATATPRSRRGSSARGGAEQIADDLAAGQSRQAIGSCARQGAAPVRRGTRRRDERGERHAEAGAAGFGDCGIAAGRTRGPRDDHERARCDLHRGLGRRSRVRQRRARAARSLLGRHADRRQHRLPGAAPQRTGWAIPADHHRPRLRRRRRSASAPPAPRTDSGSSPAAATPRFP